MEVWRGLEGCFLLETFLGLFQAPSFEEHFILGGMRIDLLKGVKEVFLEAQTKQSASWPSH